VNMSLFHMCTKCTMYTKCTPRIAKRLKLSKNSFHCRLAGWTADLFEQSGCIGSVTALFSPVSTWFLKNFRPFGFRSLAGSFCVTSAPFMPKRVQNNCEISHGRFRNAFVHFGNLYGRFVEDCAPAFGREVGISYSLCLPRACAPGLKEIPPVPGWYDVVIAFALSARKFERFS
jgi:hypothetical protein